MWGLIVTVSLGVAALPHQAHADEDDWQVGGQLGVAGVVVDGREPLGPRLGLDGQYDLDDAWAIRLSANGSRHGVSATPAKGLPGGAIYGYSIFAGLAYTMDVLRLLPSFAVGIGVLGVEGAVKKRHRAVGMQAAVGADYLMGPRWSIGGVAEYVYAPFDLISNATSGRANPQAFALSLRVSWIIH